ncbi:MAG: hypothetical protein KGI08_04795 [Thaumarchaeota archaeon]|nr:hypothetical protein [Nitrososphaerota archaeon]
MQNPTFYFKRITTDKPLGEWERVIPERWQWQAHYEDGTVLNQFDTDTPLPELGDNAFLFHQIKEVDQSKLHVFKMFSPTNPQIFTLLFNPLYMKLIHYYRIYGLDYMGEHKRVKLYVFGTETMVQGEVKKNLQVIMPTDELVWTDDMDNLVVS